MNFLQQHIGTQCDIQWHENTQYIAVQGPKSEEVLSTIIPSASRLRFLQMSYDTYDHHIIFISRSGYTGEDGFEISLPSSCVKKFMEEVLKHTDAQLIGLGARDSLRLEANLCLYGHELNEDISPLMADLSFSISKKRLLQGGFIGDKALKHQHDYGLHQKRLGFISKERPIREQTDIVLKDGTKVGFVSSGAYGATLGESIAMGYVDTAYIDNNEELFFIVRGKYYPATRHKGAFVAQHYKR